MQPRNGNVFILAQVAKDMLDDVFYDLHARVCQALADPKRLAMIHVLCDREHTVGERGAWGAGGRRSILTRPPLDDVMALAIVGLNAVASSDTPWRAGC
jgi:hypothetical protein